MNLRRWVFVAILAWALPALDARGPEVLTIDFANLSDHPTPEWLSSWSVAGGATRDGQWTVPSADPLGAGQIDLYLDPDVEIAALALTLALVPGEATDLAVNVHNAAGELIGVDLFGNLVDAAAQGRTDTFIVPLERYPDAVRVSIRRINGPVTINGLVAFPVVEALEELTPEQQRAVAEALGEKVAGKSSRANAARAARKRQADVDRILSAVDYPDRTNPSTLPGVNAFPAASAGTCYRFFTTLYFQLFPEAQPEGQLRFVSSDQAVRAVVTGSVPFALTSLPADASQREVFRNRTGYELIEVPVALDAVEVLVHPANRYETLPFDVLREIFSGDRSATFWASASGLEGPIITAGGMANWGTSRFFAERVMNGTPFRSDLAALDVAFPSGVEAFVAQNRNAIGFAQHRRRVHAVKALALGEEGAAVRADAVTVGTGQYPLVRHLWLIVAAPDPLSIPAPIRQFADLLLSREGQEVVANCGSFPLPVETVRASRARLGLP
ncbi:MAG: substrate-binding domain-containing protein [Terrimicrobiaceae bacterium]|nr:substrate-binding domain-containing protein [Terrimicrobiaceae bacterium]